MQAYALNTLLAILMSLSLVTQVVAPRPVCIVCLMAESIAPGSSCCSSEERADTPQQQTSARATECSKPQCCQPESVPANHASFCSTLDTPCICSHMPPVPALVAAPVVTKLLPEQLVELPPAMGSGVEASRVAVAGIGPVDGVNRTKPYAYRPLYLLDCRFII